MFLLPLLADVSTSCATYGSRNVVERRGTAHDDYIAKISPKLATVQLLFQKIGKFRQKEKQINKHSSSQGLLHQELTMEHIC